MKPLKYNFFTICFTYVTDNQLAAKLFIYDGKQYISEYLLLFSSAGLKMVEWQTFQSYA